MKSELHFEAFDPSSDSSVALVFMLCNTINDAGIGRGGGGAGEAVAPPVFVRLVNPIITRGADYVHHITKGPPRFLDGAASLLVLGRIVSPDKKHKYALMRKDASCTARLDLRSFV